MQNLDRTASYRLGLTLRLPAARSDRRNLVVIAAVTGLAMFVLLALFLSVVRESVRQGQLRHEATARHSAATWHCTGQRSLRLRDLCLAELNAPPPQVTLLSPP